MAEEEELRQKSSNNSNGGRSSKKQKQKKVPQRGLGVAQLERIRLEEQQKKDGFASKSPHNPIIPNYPCDVPSPNSILRPDIVNSISVHQNVPKIWNSCEYDNHLEKNSDCGVGVGIGFDPGLAFRSGLNLPFESNPIWPLPCLMQRAHYHHQNQQQHQHPRPPASMVNVSSSTISPSSLQNLYVELPSNQICYGNYTSLWPVEEKVMVGMKRQYPFCVDNHHPAPPFHCKFPPPTGRSDESISFNFREGPSCSDSISDPKKSMKENGAFSAEFLTLAPPSTTTNSKLKRPNSAYLGLHNSKSFDFDSLPYQGSMEDRVFESGASELQQYYSFLPPAISQIGQATNKISSCNGSEVAENNIDLNLKL